MSANFTFRQLVNTPNGSAVFLGYFRDGIEAQVSRYVPATEFTRDECEARKPVLTMMNRSEFEAWQKTAHFLINEVYPVGQLSLASTLAARVKKSNAAPEPELT